jgi:hypothetical protein
MRRSPVTSSAIASIGYDEVEGIMEIEFRPSGITYRYFDVPACEYLAFLNAGSKGSYFDEHFKKTGYRYRRVPPKTP